MLQTDPDKQSPAEDRYLAILEQSPVSVQILSADGYTIRVNKAWEKLWGVTLEQIGDYNILEDEQLVEKGIMPYIKRAFEGEATDIPPILYDPENSIPGLTANEEPQRWTKGIIYPIKDASGKVQEVVLLNEDISERMQAEARFKASEARYRMLFETTLDAIMIVDDQGKYIDVNESLCRILKNTRENLIGSHFSEFILPERLEDSRKAFEELGKTGVFTGDFPLRASDGSIAELEWSSRANFLPGLHVCVARDVTERKQTEEARRVSEERYQRAAESGRVGIWDLNLKTNELYLAPNLKEMLGYRDDELRNDLVEWRELIHPEDKERAIEATNNHLEGNSPRYQIEVRRRHKNGHYLHFLVQGVTIKDESGKPIRLTGSDTDITERKQTEERLRQSEERNRTLLENANDIIYSHDLQGNYLSINRAGELATGYTREQILNGLNISQVIAPDHLEKTKQMTARKLQDPNPTIYEVDIITRSGERRTLEVSTRINFKDGRPEHVEGVARDITERKFEEDEKARLMAQIEYQRRHLQDLVSNVPGVVWEAWGEPDSSNQRIDFVSDYVEKMLGYSVEEWISTPNFWYSIVHPDDREIAAQNAADTFASGEAGTNRFRWITKDGRAIWVESQSIAILDKSGEPIGMRGVTMDITERKITEEARAQLAAIIESSEDAIIGKTLGGIVTSWNPAAEKMYGYPAVEAIGQHISMIAPADRVQEIEQILKKVSRGEHVEHSETIRKSRDGRYLHISLTVSPIKDSSNKIIGASTIARDITERKQKETNERFLAEASTALASSLDYETTLGTVTELAVPHFADWCAIDILNEDGKLNRLAVAHTDPEKVSWAREIYQQYPPDPNDAQGLFNVLRTGQSEFYPEIPDELLVQGARDKGHLEILRKVGFRSLMLVPLKIRERVFGVISFVNTESWRAHTREDLALAENLAGRASLAVENARLFRSEQQTREAAERTSDLLRLLQTVSASLSQALTPQEVATAVVEQGINTLGAHAGILVLLNEARQELEIVGTVGFPAEVTEQWKRFSLAQKVPIADSIRNKTPLFIESFEAYQKEYPGLGPLSSVTGSEALVAFPLIIEGQTIGGMGLSFPRVQSFTEDDRAFMLALAQQCAQALERARLYENEQRLRAHAESANRMKDEFLATVSHELRTPLNAIVGWSSMLVNGKFDEEVTARAIETIERNARSQAQIIDDLLDVSRIITGKLYLDAKPTQLDVIINTTLEGLRPAAESKGLIMKSVFHPNAKTVWGDPVRLQQVIWNLLSNAVKFTPKGGEVEVRLDRIESHIQILVKDTGQGISREFLPFVFDRFRQADGTSTRRHGGLGLGLAIVRHLVEMHGGIVRVESPGENQGSTFIVELPILALQNEDPDVVAFAEQSNETKSFEYSPVLENLRILIVDDEADARLLLETITSGCGAEVIAVESVSEALKKFNDFNPQILISDIGMPDEDGYSLIRKIRELSKAEGGNVPAVALTAYAREEDRLQALEAGFQIHLAKPVNPSELIEAVKNLAENDRNH